MNRGLKLVALWLVLSAAPVQAALVWQPAPAGAEHNRRGPLPLLLQGNTGEATVLLWKPTLETLSPAADGNRYLVRGTGMDNYHALVAEASGDGWYESAVRYLYQFGRPSGESPSRLVNAVKTPLELTPAPLPREHWRYRANHPASFILHFDGLPVADAGVQLTTSQGSQQQLRTDPAGRLQFALPDDFARVEPGHNANRAAEFVLQASLLQNGVRYSTSLSAPYDVDEASWQSLPAGALVLGLGFIAGIVINRRSLTSRESR